MKTLRELKKRPAFQPAVSYREPPAFPPAVVRESLIDCPP
jgi:hypothetical protein